MAAISGTQGDDVLVGTPDADMIDALAGNDTISPGAGADMVLGGAGNDVVEFVVSEGPDTIDLGIGDDRVNVGVTTNTVRLTFASTGVGDGNVLASGAQPAQGGGLAVSLQLTQIIPVLFGGVIGTTGPISRFDDEGISFASNSFDVRDRASSLNPSVFGFVSLGTTADDVLSTASPTRSAYLNGGFGNDLLTGGSESDFLVGGLGADTLVGGGSNDSLEGGAGDDVISGGDGLDTAIFGVPYASAQVSYAGNRATVVSAADRDELVDIERLVFTDAVVGTPGSDTLTNFDMPRVTTILGLAGDDTFTPGAAFNTVFFGGSGIDTAQVRVPTTRLDGFSFEGERTIVEASFRFNQSAPAAYIGVERFELSNGIVLDRADGAPLVDDVFYLAINRDVFAAGLDAEAHYFADGAREGRDPNPFFSTNGYLSANPDVRAAGVNPLTHYDRDGFREGRDPSVLFDNEAYLRAYPDVARAGLDPLAHYLANGQEEGRRAFVASGTPADIAENGFDREYYLLANPDVGAAGVDARAHYEGPGFREGRNPNAFFDTAAYLNTYTDVRAAGLNPLDHYHANGFREGRDPSARFDTSLYLDVNSDVRAAGIDPLAHYLESGRAEGRTAFADGTLLG